MYNIQLHHSNNLSNSSIPFGWLGEMTVIKESTIFNPFFKNKKDTQVPVCIYLPEGMKM